MTEAIDEVIPWDKTVRVLSHPFEKDFTVGEMTNRHAEQYVCGDAAGSSAGTGDEYGTYWGVIFRFKDEGRVHSACCGRVKMASGASSLTSHSRNKGGSTSPVRSTTKVEVRLTASCARTVHDRSLDRRPWSSRPLQELVFLLKGNRRCVVS